MIADDLLKRCLLNLIPMNNAGEQVRRDVQAYLTEFAEDTITPVVAEPTVKEEPQVNDIMNKLYEWHYDRDTQGTREILTWVIEDSPRGRDRKQVVVEVYSELKRRFPRAESEMIRAEFFRHPRILELWRN